MKDIHIHQKVFKGGGDEIVAMKLTCCLVDISITRMTTSINAKLMKEQINEGPLNSFFCLILKISEMAGLVILWFSEEHL